MTSFWSMRPMLQIPTEHRESSLRTSWIIPPTLAELHRRLVGRGTDTERAIEARLIRARQEYAEADFYDYIIINDDPDRAAKELAAIMLAERCKAEGRMHFLREAIEE